MVSRSHAASSAAEAAVPCAWPPCGALFVPRTSGGKRQTFHAPKCRELAKAARRIVCPKCGASLSQRGSR